MGKRELVIIAAFALLGMIAYQLTAPAPKPGERSFSWSAIAAPWQRPSRNRAQAQTTREGTSRTTAATTELSITGASTMVVIGEDRADISWTLNVQANGPDEAAATSAAESVALVSDDMGSVLALNVRAPRDARPTTTLTARVPHALGLRLDTARSVTVAGVASARFDSAVGDMDIRDVAGLVSGAHRTGTLKISNAGSVILNLVGSGATVMGVRGETQVTARNGSTRLRDTAGPITVDAANGLVEVLRPHAAVRVTVSAGTATISEPHAAVRLDARNTTVSIDLATPVPVTAMAVEGRLRLALDDTLPVTLDAVADQGTIVAPELGLTPAATARGAELHHAFGSAARIALRIERGEIEITHRK